MKIELNEELAEMVGKAAEDNNMSTDEFVEGLIHYGFDSSIAVLRMAKIEALLVEEILPRIKQLEVGSNNETGVLQKKRYIKRA